MDSNEQKLQALKIETSMFTLTQICFDKCTEGLNFYKISKLPKEKNLEIYSKFESCLKNCTVTLVQTKNYIKSKFDQDVESTSNKNTEIYKDFYK